VELVGNGTIALEKLHNQTYDLILSDVKMPDTDGPRLHTQLERHHPELLRRVAFLTGDTLSAETREFLERTRVPTIAKPFTLEQVRTLIQQIVRGR
jgi:CheY-like chemotaxis protein